MLAGHTRSATKEEDEKIEFYIARHIAVCARSVEHAKLIQ